MFHQIGTTTGKISYDHPSGDLCKGACTYDVCTGSPKAGCVKMQTRGEGVNKSENFADVICTWPLMANLQLHAMMQQQRKV